MYTIFKNVINNSKFELTDITNKIDTLWVQGKLTDDQRNELIGLAQKKANPENSYSSLQFQINELAKMVKELVKKVDALSSTETETEEEYPEYVQPTGAHDAYATNDRITYDGKKYVCVAPEGVSVVWNPDVYPAYWEEVTAE